MLSYDFTTYVTLDLEGDTATTLGALIPKIVDASSRNDTVAVAVAVKAIIFTDFGVRLRNSPMRCNTFWNVSPLQ